MIFTMPLPQILATTMMAMATRASHQQVEALLMAEPERFRPMHDDHGAGDDGGEVTHDRLGPQHLKEQSQHQIQETGDDDAAQSVGQLQLGIQTRHRRVHGGHGGEAAQVGEGGTKESGDLELGAHMEQQGAHDRPSEQGGLDAQGQAVALNQNGHQHGGAKHGEHDAASLKSAYGGCPGCGRRSRLPDRGWVSFSRSCFSPLVTHKSSI